MNVCILGDARSVHLQRIVPGLVQRGLGVHVISHHAAELDGATVEKFSVPPFQWGYLSRWAGRWRRYLRNLFRRFDIVHVHFMHDWGLTPDLAAEGCLMITPWGSDIVPPPGEEAPSLHQVRRRRELLSAAAGVTAWGNWFAETLVRFAALPPDRVHRIPLSVDTGWFCPLDEATMRRRHEATKEGPTSGRMDATPMGRPLPFMPSCLRAVVPFRVGFFKGFRPVYGPSYLLRAIPTVLETLPDTRFDLVGDGAELLECRRLTALLEIEHAVRFFPRQPHRNIRNYLRGWDLSVIPSLQESFGVAALESSAVAVPVVASRVGGLVDTVLDGSTGVLVPPAAPEHLADAIVNLLRDAPLRDRLGGAGRRFVAENFDHEEVMDQWVGAYHEVREQSLVMV